MQAYRISPCARLSGCGPTSPSPSRTVPTFFPIIPSELTPLLRLLERPSSGVATAPAPVPAPSPSPSRRCGRGSHNKNKNAPYPRFDVKETAIAFELQGEFPGFKQEDLSIDFVDADTLVIRGHNNNEGVVVVESKNQSSAEVNSSEKEEKEEEEEEEEEASPTPVAAAAESPNTTLVAEGKKTSNPYKVMVEDEDEEFVDAGAEVSDGEVMTPATSSIVAQPITTTTTEASTPAGKGHSDNEKDGQGKESKAKYWVHERATGRFERGFRFPSLVDRDNVKANLKDGVLSIVVPKVVERKERRIVVE